MRCSTPGAGHCGDLVREIVAWFGTPETCPHGQKGWKHAAECIKHHCAHDFDTGPQQEWTYPEGGGVVTRSCACGMTAFSHDMRYAP